MTQNQLPIHRSAGIIIDTGTSWLLQKRDNKDGILWPNKIDIWGGSMEAVDESDFEQNALRELREETGLTAEDVKLIRFGSMSFTHQTMSGELVQHETRLFVAKLKTNTGIHVYEGQAAVAIDPNKELSNVDEFAPGTLDSIEQLKTYYRSTEGGH